MLMRAAHPRPTWPAPTPSLTGAALADNVGSIRRRTCRRASVSRRRTSASWADECRPSLIAAEASWSSTVRGPRKSRSQISGVVLPSAAAEATASSRGESRSVKLTPRRRQGAPRRDDAASSALRPRLGRQASQTASSAPARIGCHPAGGRRRLAGRHRGARCALAPNGPHASPPRTEPPPRTKRRSSPSSREESAAARHGREGPRAASSARRRAGSASNACCASSLRPASA